MADAAPQDDVLRNIRKLCAKQALPVLVIVGLAPLLVSGLSELDVRAAFQALADLPAWQWLVAVALTAVSYWAIGRYDGVVHQMMRSPTELPTARTAGIVSISLSQCTGFGIIVGTLARWRMLPDTSLPRALGLTAVISTCFLVGWAAVTGFALLAMPSALPLAGWLGAATLLCIGMIAALCLICPTLKLGSITVSLPNLPICAKLVGLAAVDLTAAGLAFWFLLPPDAALSFALLFPAYLIAFTAGLLGSTPAGLGPFEMMLLSLLPLAAEPDLVVALLAFRIVYYLLPASVAAVALFIGPPGSRGSNRPKMHEAGADLPNVLRAVVRQSRRAELALVHQGTHRLLEVVNPRRGWLVGETPSFDVGLTDPFGPAATHKHAIGELASLSQRWSKIPVIYKCSARLAVRARQAGFALAKISQEAVIDPSRFNLQGSAHRQLRRKLRQACKAGVEVAAERGPLSDEQSASLAAIDAAWQFDRPARGFSMGRFCPAYVAWQRRFVAYHRGAPIAFITLHSNQHEWVLDLIRHNPDIPDGTMHALVLAAIDEAEALACTRFSLAALPLPPDNSEPWFVRLMRRRLCNEAAGLRQFKNCFAPRYEPLYAAAPSWPTLLWAGWEISRAILHPEPLPERPVQKDTIVPLTSEASIQRAA
ncbi:MAG: phosphatidylglycerol lysyltransferase domain-containing protein [Pseudomonadota bacterium]